MSTTAAPPTTLTLVTNSVPHRLRTFYCFQLFHKHHPWYNDSALKASLGASISIQPLWAYILVKGKDLENSNSAVSPAYIASFDVIHFLYASSYDAQKTKYTFNWAKKHLNRTFKADFTLDDAHGLAKHLVNSFIVIMHLTGSSTTAKAQTCNTHSDVTYVIDKLSDKTFTHVWHLHLRHM